MCLSGASQDSPCGGAAAAAAGLTRALFDITCGQCEIRQHPQMSDRKAPEGHTCTYSFTKQEVTERRAHEQLL